MGVLTVELRKTGADFASASTSVNAGIKPRLIASYNHLGNNDGRNLDAAHGGELQFRSKEISKSSVVDDMVEANHLLYKPLASRTADSKDGFVKGHTTEHPDHVVKIVYMPAAGDDKKALE